ncbi:hypothetical protein NC651_000434 [Populus alba x Populus x berolinensis]|nr:hypothetical protein NC651_000434 [Populus alba x Populus x berolinensis]
MKFQEQIILSKIVIQHEVKVKVLRHMSRSWMQFTADSNKPGTKLFLTVISNTVNQQSQSQE